jgi:hypothetical protein
LNFMGRISWNYTVIRTPDHAALRHAVATGVLRR